MKYIFVNNLDVLLTILHLQNNYTSSQNETKLTFYPNFAHIHIKQLKLTSANIKSYFNAYVTYLQYITDNNEQ